MPFKGISYQEVKSLHPATNCPLGVSCITDRVSKATRSRMMGKVRGKNTLPELTVRRILHRNGFRFRLHRSDLPGTPDIVLPRYKCAIFVHGCFWHGHSCPKGKIPASNREFWAKKISKNRARDFTAVEELAAMDWRPIVIWECALQEGIDLAIASLRKSVRQED